jgi:transmembrane sensor
MTVDQEYWKKISAYLAGHLTSEEEAVLDHWRSSSAENEVVFSEAKRIWLNSGLKLRLPEDDTNAQWQALQTRIDQDRQQGKTRFFTSNILLKIAAGLLILAGLTYTFLRPASEDDSIMLSTGSEVVAFYLPDSTRIWLNAHSILTYEKDYGEHNRETNLAGEAYFKVKPDSAHPFIVATKNASVQVVGTSFNLKEDTAAVTVTVAEGAVKFAGSNSTEARTVKKDERAVVTEKGEIQHSKNTDARFASWREVNNREFETEKANPKTFLSTHYTWRKNQINQSVIEGTLKNSASLAGYKNITLKVTYTKPNGKYTTVRLKIYDTVHAGETLPYQKRLLDILTDTKNVKVEIEQADVITTGNH